MRLEFVRTPTVGKKYICPNCHYEVLYEYEQIDPVCDQCFSIVFVFQLHLEIVEGE